MIQETPYGDTESANAAFWDTLCGTAHARNLGITDNKAESLARYDAWYFSFYPYLNRHLRPDLLRGQRVLEVGLGYGTVAQSLAAKGAIYSGLDIASGPVAMVNHRLRQSSLPETAQCGSILAAPFADHSFDAIIAIGCFHHTGHTQRAIQEAWRMLVPGGRLVFMVYYAFSYRRWRSQPWPTFRHAICQPFGIRGLSQSQSAERSAYDQDTEGRPAPHTEFYGRIELRRMCKMFSRCDITLENINQEPPFRASREELLATRWPKYVGLDAYVTCIK